MKMPPIDRVDNLNFSVCRLRLLLDDKQVSTATGFFYFMELNNQPSTFLVTNWHVLTGRNPENPAVTPHDHPGFPNRMNISLMLSAAASPSSSPDTLFQKEHTIVLFDENGSASWYQHQTFKNRVDIAILNTGNAFADCRIHHVNIECNAYDMAILQGMDVFILGYPIGFSHFINTPIWKKGCIASEPHVEAADAYGRIVIDATTRNGMSGSPVIARANPHYITEDGNVKCVPRAGRFIGVYASRPDLRHRDKTGANIDIGYTYKSGLIDAIIAGGIRGPNYGDLP
jgi:hypothetical protein